MKKSTFIVISTLNLNLFANNASADTYVRNTTDFFIDSCISDCNAKQCGTNYENGTACLRKCKNRQIIMCKKHFAKLKEELKDFGTKLVRHLKDDPEFNNPENIKFFRTYLNEADAATSISDADSDVVHVSDFNASKRGEEIKKKIRNVIDAYIDTFSFKEGQKKYYLKNKVNVKAAIEMVKNDGSTDLKRFLSKGEKQAVYNFLRDAFE